MRVQPRASRTALTGIAGGSLRLSLTSPPVEGAANAACTEFFADILSIAKSKVAVVAGAKSRDKTLRAAGVSKAAFLAAIAGKV